MPRTSPIWLSVALVSLLAATLTPTRAAAGDFTVEEHDDGVKILLDGQLFTNYLKKSGTKPILWPILGPTGAPMTRAFPMERIKGEKMDHPHHRSLWFTHGSVNGVDFWLESKTKGGQEVHREFKKVAGGPQAVVSAVVDWIAPDGKKVLEDERTYTFRTDGDARMIDFDITLTATEGEVKFGDTKEGTFGVRVPTVMDVESKKGGKIVNSEGLVDAAAWGKPAAWVDYHGPVNDEVVGVAILNHPASFRFPTTWHVRTYGLFAANPFGWHDFTGDSAQDGSHTLAAGEKLTFRYRVVFHKGDEKQGAIAEQFSKYSQAAAQ
ncbi:MAG: PmoA family protein [Planctomycetaceae bacterium]|nr:PmoA family protein [Planctomycetaceae bacterium]